MAKSKKSKPAKKLEKQKQKLEKQPEKEELKDDLLTIYQDKDGQLPDMVSFEKKERNTLRMIFFFSVVLLVFLAIVSWIGFFLFQPTDQFVGEGVELRIESPTEVSSGEEISYIISYKNNETVPLAQMELTLRYSEGFVFKEADQEPSNDSNTVWQLGSLSQNRSGELKVTGSLVGKVDEEHILQAALNYKPGNFSSNFQEIASISTKITETNVELSIDVPEQALPDEEIEYTVSYKNITEDNLTNLQLKLAYPENFKVSERDPESTNEFDLWEIKELEAGAEEDITIKGAFSKESSGDQEFGAEMALLIDDEAIVQAEKQGITAILKGNIIVRLIADGSSEDGAADAGDKINYSVVIQNKGDNTIKDLIAEVKLPSSSLDPNSYQSDEDGDFSDGSVVWTKDEIAELGEMDPKDELTIDFSMATFDDPSEESIIKGVVELKIAQIGEVEEEVILTSNTLFTRLNSDLDFVSTVRYVDDDGETVGSGPLPPKVGEVTKFRVFWTLTNSVHEARSISITSSLPENVQWVESTRVSAGELTLDAESREISYKLSRMPTSVEKVTIYFDIAITPTEEEVGDLIKLINKASLQATDKVSGGKFAISSPFATTNIDDDPEKSGQGTVTE